MTEKRTKRILEYDKIKETLIDFAISIYGKEMCSSLEPSSSKDEVLSTLNQTDEAIKLILGKNSPPLGGIPDIREYLVIAKSNAMLLCTQLYYIGHFLNGIQKLIKFKDNLPEELKNNYLNGLIDKLILLTNVQDSINRCVANDEELYDGASKELSTIRKKIKSSQNEVKKVLDKIVKDHPDDLQEQLVTMRGNRYVVMVKIDRRSAIPGIVHDTSSSKATLFVEPFAVVEINNKIREYFSMEREEIERILMNLSREVSEEIDVFYHNITLIEQIDFINAKGKLAIKMDAMIPHINDDGHIKLIDARHPLIPKEDVVPITIEIGDEFKTLVITGPNTGGKTVSLKTCGLLTLMAMSGLAIPAKEASIVSIFDFVCADIGDEQSIEQSLSTFSSHMTNLVNIINKACGSTLVLVDELGSGTDPTSGAALAISILEYFKEKGCITLATTHYKELKHYAISTSGVQNASCEFDVETLRPTYRLLIGIPGVSNAFHISARLGLPQHIIEKAKDLISEEEANFEHLIEQTQQSRIKAQELEIESKTNFENSKIQLEKYNKLTQELNKKREDIISKARQDARTYLQQEYWEVTDLIEEIKNDIKSRDLEDIQKDLNDIRRIIKDKSSRVDNEIFNSTLNKPLPGEVPTKFIIGQSYYCGVFDSTGVLVEHKTGKKTAILSIENKIVNVPTTSLRLVSNETSSNKQDTYNKKRHKLKKSTNSAFKPEIMLIGLTVYQAIDKLDKYIDDAVLSGVGSVRIVHGKGSGALRAAVNDMLKSDGRISSFRQGEFGEGDSGVTIASL